MSGTPIAAPTPWWEVLGVASTASAAAITQAYRRLAKTAHPNAGGDRAAWDRLSAAYAAAQQEKGT